MTVPGFAVFGLKVARHDLSRVSAPILARDSRISRASPTRILRIEQSSSDHVEIRQRRRHLEAVQVLRQAAVPDFAEPKYVLDDAKHVLDLGAHPRLVAVLRLLDLIDSAVEAITTVREVLRFWRRPPSFQ